MPRSYLGAPFTIECPCMRSYGGFVSAQAAREEIWKYHKRCGGMKSHRILDNDNNPINDGVMNTEPVERVEGDRGVMMRDEYDHEKARKAQNDFLKFHGYEWRKRSMKLSNGRLVERWFLIDPDGKAVVGFKDGGGGYTFRFGNINAILEKLGYYRNKKEDNGS